MSPSSQYSQRVCPSCGAELSDGNVCWLCRSDTPNSQQKVAKPSAPNTSAPIQFGLDSILLLMTFVAVLCVFTVAPGVAVVAAVLSLPALIRTAILARRDHVAGQPMGWKVKSLAFLATTSFVVVLLAAMSAAFYATCWVGFWSGAMAHELVDRGAGFDSIGTGFIVGIPLGLIAAGFVMWWLIRRVVKTNYRVPAWTGWFGFVAALGGMLLFWLYHSRNGDAASFVLSVSGIGLVFSLLSLGTPQRWTCAWGAGLGAGPLLSALGTLFTHDDMAWLNSLAAPIAATLIGLIIAVILHLSVMGPEYSSPD